MKGGGFIKWIVAVMMMVVEGCLRKTLRVLLSLYMIRLFVLAEKMKYKKN